MWYKLMIWCIVFDLIIIGLAPFFGNIIVSGSAIADTSINTTSDLISTGVNPTSFIGGITSISIGGVVAYGSIFLIVNGILILCIVKLIRGS